MSDTLKYSLQVFFFVVVVVVEGNILYKWMVLRACDHLFTSKQYSYRMSFYSAAFNDLHFLYV